MDRGETTGWTAVWRSGPDAGAAIDLPRGRHLLGRAHTAGVRCDDSTLQPHHALIEVADDDSVWLTQLTGRTPLRVDRQPIDGPTELMDGTVVDIGISTFVLLGERIAPQSAHVRDGAVVRVPRAVPQWQAREVAAPGERPVREASSGGLLPALLALAGAGAIALLLRQPMFLLFGALGALVAIGSWIAQRAAAVGRFRASLVEYEQALTAYEEHVMREHLAWRRHQLATVSTAHRAVQTLVTRGVELWTRRRGHGDAFLAAIGMDPTDGAVPVAVDLGPGCRIALGGPFAGAVARSLIVQLVASCGPADLRIVVVTDHPQRWDCVRALPHLGLPDGVAAIVVEAHLLRVLDDLQAHAAQGGQILFVTDQPALLGTRTSPLRRAVADEQRDALIVVLPSAIASADAAVPHVCNSVLTTASGASARWVADVRSTMLPQHVQLVGIGERTTARCSAALRGLIDPEDPLSAATVVPRQLSLVALLHDVGGRALTAGAIAAGWVAAGSDPAPRATIGMAADGVVDIDLVRDGPHGLIAGTTGAGKSELLRSLVVSLAAASSPAHLTFVLVDYKGGATFDACAALPHVVGLVTDLDDQLADRALRSLHAELRRREALLREHGAADLSELRAQAPSVTLPRLVVVIDEFAALVAEQPTFLHALVGIAQRGRSLGVHLLLATQRPNGVITDDIRANTNLRLALRLQDTADAVDVVGMAAPAHLPRGLPGRAVLRLDAEHHVTFQAAQCTVATADGRDTDLTLMVRAICDAARLAGVASPSAPWLPPLPEVLTCADLGVVDEPDLQRVSPLRWSRRDGRLAVVGSAGSGVTSTLLTIVDRTLLSEGDADVYVVDARGDERWTALATHPRCVAVVQLHESERLQRLLHRLRNQVINRRGDHAPTLLVVDGLDALRRTLDDVETAAEYDALEQLLAEADTAGVTVVAGAELAAALPMAFLNRCPARWVLHLHDAHDAALLGVAARNVPAAVPGRIVIAGSESMAQLVAPRATTSRAATSASTAAPIIVVPARIEAALLPSSHAADGVSSLSLGIDFTTGEPFALDVPDGEHVLLVGGARSGRSTGLARIAAAWSQAHPVGWVGAVTPRRSTFPRDLAARNARDTSAVAALLDELTAHLANGPALLIIDDAETIEDPGARLAQLAANSPGLCIAAAGRPDALRQSYGHWTTVIRRSRLGFVASMANELDGDLLSVQVPRRPSVPARPGLWWVADGRPVRLMQMAIDERSAMSEELSAAAAM